MGVDNWGYSVDGSRDRAVSSVQPAQPERNYAERHALVADDDGLCPVLRRLAQVAELALQCPRGAQPGLCRIRVPQLHRNRSELLPEVSRLCSEWP